MANHSPPDEWYGIVLIPVYSSVRRYTLAILCYLGRFTLADIYATAFQ